MGNIANIGKMIDLSMPNWRKAKEAGAVKILVNGMQDNKLETVDNHSFINMCSCSYLGLNEHPAIIQGAKDAMDEFGFVALSLSRARVGHVFVEDDRTNVVYPICLSCKIVNLLYHSLGRYFAILASGRFTDGIKPVMVFDKKAHFSMNVMKASCADETQVETCNHNDIAYLEQMCKENDRVAYICDGAYSTGGKAPFDELQRLQKEYGMFLYIDDSHSISCFGENGIGIARSAFDTLGDNTIIIASLNKGFGSGGGVIMLGNAEQKEILDFCGGPLCWSQTMNTSSLGAIKASTMLHLSGAITPLQQVLQQRVDYIDSRIPTETAGNGLAIRRIDLPNSPDAAIEASAKIMAEGFYVSALFFPIIARNTAGIRIMCRASISEQDMTRFCDVVERFI